MNKAKLIEKSIFAFEMDELYRLSESNYSYEEEIEKENKKEEERRIAELEMAHSRELSAVEYELFGKFTSWTIGMGYDEILFVTFMRTYKNLLALKYNSMMEQFDATQKEVIEKYLPKGNANEVINKCLNDLGITKRSSRSEKERVLKVFYFEPIVELWRELR